jgi:hypothetical protein
MTLRVIALKGEAPLAPGYARSYDQCKTCERIYYRDFVPFSLSSPVITLPCGHGATVRYLDAVRIVGRKPK